MKSGIRPKWERAQHLQRRVDRVLSEPAEAGQERVADADHGADHEPQQHPLDRHQGRRAERALADEVGRGGRDLRGRGELALGDDAGEAEEPPGPDDQERRDAAAQPGVARPVVGPGTGLRRWRGLDRSLTTSGTGGDDVAGGMHNRSSEKIEVNQLTH